MTTYRDAQDEIETLRADLATWEAACASAMAENVALTEERDRYREHSITLNSIGYRTAEALSDAKGEGSYVGNPVKQVDAVPEATDRTEHILSVGWDGTGYRATCSCGYRSRRYKVLTANARYAWEAHVRVVTRNLPRGDGGRFVEVAP